MPKSFKKIIKRSSRSKGALRALQKELVKDTWYRSLIGTTQAIDIIQGAHTNQALTTSQSLQV
jgi:Gly-Xaa carboxypeptidase